VITDDFQHLRGKKTPSQQEVCHEAKTFVFFVAFFLKAPSLHHFLMTLRALEGMCTIPASRALYAKLHFVENFV